MKSKAKNGFIKELAKPGKAGASANTPFAYSKPIAKVERVQNLAVNSRTREHRSVKQDKSTNFVVEQKISKDSHKGSK